MLANYTFGVPGYPVHGMPMQTSVPIVTQQALPPVAPAQVAPSNTSGLLEFSQMLVDTKVGMSKIDLKLDEVLKKVDSIKEAPISKALVPVSNPDTPSLIDPNLVLHSITKVVEESRTLKQELVDRDARIEALNQKSRQLLETNQRYVEQSQQVMALRSDSIHSLSSANNSHIIKLQEENSGLKARMDEFKRKLESRNLEMGEQESDVNEMRKRNELLTQKMNQARNKFREKESEIEELKGEIDKLHREAGKQKSTRHSALKEATDLNETIEELRENVKSEKQSKKKIQNKLTRLDEELTEVRSERDRLTSVIEDKRKKQQSDKSKMLREVDEIKRGYEDEISVLRSQMHQSTGPTQADLAKLETNWKRKMQEGIARSVSELEDKCEELEASEQKLKSQVQRFEKKVTTLSLENSHLQQENSRVIQELDEFDSVKSRNATSQGLIDKQNVMIEQFNLRENELRNDLTESKEKERDLLEETQVLGEKIRDLESHQQISDNDEWRNRVRHVMNKFYASVQARFSSQNTFTGIQVQEILIEAIKVETERVLRQDTESTDTEDSADEARTSQNSLTNNSIGATDNQHSGQSPNRIESGSPIPQQSADHTVTSSPLKGNSPIPLQSADHTVTSSPLRGNSPIPLQSADHTVTSSPLKGNSPIPLQSDDHAVTSSPLRGNSPIPLQSADHTVTSSPLKGNSPIPLQSADHAVTSSPLRGNSPIPQQSADHTVTSSPLRGNSPIPLQSADHAVTSSQLGNPRVLSVESEDSVDDTVQTKLESSSVTDVDIHHTVVPLHSAIDSVPLPDSTLSTDQQTPQPHDTYNSSPVDNPTMYHSPISSPIPIQKQTQSALDQSPIGSPITSRTPIELSPSSSPIPYQHLSKSPPSSQSPNPSIHTISDPIQLKPDISDNIQEYLQTPLTESPPFLSPISTPPLDCSYKHVTTHSASPPPMDIPAPLGGGDSLRTGNFSPELIDKHFSYSTIDDTTSSLDPIIGISFPSLQESINVKPQTKPYSYDTESKTMDASDVIPESNPLLDGSGDSENEIFFGPAKKKEPPPMEPEKPTQNSLFEDSDDDLDWLNN